MKEKRLLCLMLCILWVLWDCEGSHPWDIELPDPLFLPSISRIYLDERMLDLDSCNSDTIRIPLPVQVYTSRPCSLQWDLEDPDDPAYSSEIDPNNNLGGDNALTGILAVEMTSTEHHNQNHYTSRNTLLIFKNHFEPWALGDNFLVKVWRVDSIMIQDSISLNIWRKLKIQYDCMEGCELDFGWLQYVFEGYGSSHTPPDPNDQTWNPDRCTYYEFKQSYVWYDDTMLERRTFDTYANRSTFLRNWFISDTTTVFHDSLIPWYVAGVYDYAGVPDSIGGETLLIPSEGSSGEDTLRVSLIYWANDSIAYFSDDFNKALSLVTIHELGHQIARLEHYDHTSSDCIMNSPLPNPIGNYDPFFCPKCVHKFRQRALPPRKTSSQTEGVVVW